MSTYHTGAAAIIRDIVREVFHSHESFSALDVRKVLRERNVVVGKQALGTALWRMWEKKELRMTNWNHTRRGLADGARRRYTFFPEPARVGAVLTMLKDGMDGIDLGVVGSFQYALRSYETTPGFGDREIVRRAAVYVGQYGGWRFESTAAHVQQYNLPEGLSDRLNEVNTRAAT